MIIIKTRCKFILYAIVVVLTIMAIIGFMCCEHKSDKAILLNCVVTDTTIEDNERTVGVENSEEGDDSKPIELVSLGVFKLTAYCSCYKCCGIWANNRPNGIVYGAIGEELSEGYSIAVDPKVIPYRTEIIIDGHTYKAQDCDGGIKGNEIDIYFEDHGEALKFGVQYEEVFASAS